MSPVRKKLFRKARGALGMVPVTKHYVRPASHDLARLTYVHWCARRRVDYLDVSPGTRLSTGGQESPDSAFRVFQTREEARLGRPV